MSTRTPSSPSMRAKRSRLNPANKGPLSKALSNKASTYSYTANPAFLKKPTSKL